MMCGSNKERRLVWLDMIVFFLWLEQLSGTHEQVL